jgi:hypothetical protein
MYRLVMGMLLLAPVSACAPGGATSPGPPPAPPASIQENSTGVHVRLNSNPRRMVATVDAGVERVWSVLPEVYRTLGITAEVNDPAARVYGSRRVTVNQIEGKRTSSWVRCGHEGSGASAMSAYRYRLTVLSTVSPAADGKATVATEVSGSATPVEGTSSGAVHCVSNGGLEQRIAELAAARAAGS